MKTTTKSYCLPFLSESGSIQIEIVNIIVYSNSALITCKFHYLARGPKSQCFILINVEIESADVEVDYIDLEVLSENTLKAQIWKSHDEIWKGSLLVRYTRFLGQNAMCYTSKS